MKRIEKKEVVTKRSGTKIICPICAKKNSDRSFPGVEHEPKRIEKAHSGTRKLHRDSNVYETIHQ